MKTHMVVAEEGVALAEEEDEAVEEVQAMAVMVNNSNRTWENHNVAQAPETNRGV